MIWGDPRDPSWERPEWLLVCRRLIDEGKAPRYASLGRKPFEDFVYSRGTTYVGFVLYPGSDKEIADSISVEVSILPPPIYQDECYVIVDADRNILARSPAVWETALGSKP